MTKMNFKTSRELRKSKEVHFKNSKQRLNICNNLSLKLNNEYRKFAVFVIKRKFDIQFSSKSEMMYIHFHSLVLDLNMQCIINIHMYI